MSVDVQQQQNWSGNLTYRASALLEPRTVEELQEVVARATRLKALGSRHSFNDVADTTGEQVSLALMPEDVEIDIRSESVGEIDSTVTVSGGATYGALARALQSQGWALHNLASLPHISVAGAVATGTHGSGDRNASLSSAVRALELVRADGELVRLERGHPDFAGAVVGLGALGVVSRITLDVVPTFGVRQDVYETLGWDAWLANADAITSAGYSVSTFTGWTGDVADQVWIKSVVEPGTRGSAPEDLFGARPATRERHPLPMMDGADATPQLGSPGAWLDRLPHFKMGFTPSNGEEIQSEYLLPRTALAPAVEALRAVADRFSGILQVCEIRTVAADDLWLSPSGERDTVGFHFTWLRRPEEVLEALRPVEAALLPLGARPHWGKVFRADRAHLESVYPRLGDFRDLARRMDPEGVFHNDFLTRTVLAG